MTHSEEYNPEFGISPAQYHAYVDFLWSLLPSTKRNDNDNGWNVFEKIGRYIEDLKEDVEYHKLHYKVHNQI